MIHYQKQENNFLRMHLNIYQIVVIIKEVLPMDINGHLIKKIQLVHIDVFLKKGNKYINIQ